MKKGNLNILIVTIFLCLGMQSIAQKSGHLNFGNLIAMLPETKSADIELESYHKVLIQKSEAMVAKLQEENNNFINDAKSGMLTSAQQSENEAYVLNKEQEILMYQQQIAQLLDQKREELLSPIVKRANQAIKDVAEEQGYIIVFDTSVFNAVLYAMESDDLMPQVKHKLGI
ncbi:OmpH family outer membrane protein [Aequorivita viscosa]|nr:OmpH family outer membrane protein [Aequorivita viscosa]